MNKKTAQRNGNASIIILVILLLASIAALLYFYFLKPKQSVNLPSNEKIVEKVEAIDASTWLTYPPKGIEELWSIKHPAKNTPLANEKNTQITIGEQNNESVLIVLKSDNIFQGTDIETQLKSFTDSKTCVLKVGVTKISLNGYDAYTFKSECGEITPETILSKEKTAYIIVNPYKSQNYLLIEVYTNNKIATDTQKELAQKITETIQINKPVVAEKLVEKPMDDGLLTFTDTSLGFSLKYPTTYRIEKDSGWKNAGLILYSGGQTYDLVVQSWNTEAEYKKYFEENIGTPQTLVVKKIGNKYVTFLNMGEDKDVDTVISSYKLEENQ